MRKYLKPILIVSSFSLPQVCTFSDPNLGDFFDDTWTKPKK